MHFTLACILEQHAQRLGTTVDALNQMPYIETVVRIGAGDTASAPGTTKKVLAGPAVIKYAVHRDGGAAVLDEGGARLTYLPR